MLVAEDGNTKWITDHLAVSRTMREFFEELATAAGMNTRDLVDMYQSEIRDLLAGRLGRQQPCYGTAENGIPEPVYAPIPSLLDRLKQRAHDELEAKLGKLLEPVAGK